MFRCAYGSVWHVVMCALLMTVMLYHIISYDITAYHYVIAYCITMLYNCYVYIYIYVFALITTDKSK